LAISSALIFRSAASVDFIDENDGCPGVRLRQSEYSAYQISLSGPGTLFSQAHERRHQL
jgi:hypothetical protein